MTTRAAPRLVSTVTRAATAIRTTPARCSLCPISSSNAKISLMLPFKVIYHPRYDLNLGPHVFPSQKFRLIYELLLRDNIAAPPDVVEPPAATDDDLLRVHNPEWVGKLKNGTLTA